MAGSYYKVACPDCGNEQIVFGKAASVVNCAVCGSTLATPTGGEAEFTGEVVETVEKRAERNEA
ncbi:30S ribosomal protein S27e [Salinirubrum litoreum]|jgi:small subunit ribosomal protein S27e|uniref:Small ribosomal subunit protein eS27 n=1 Tax=Salinirubrum litoreum TaxID=1126234 RepID=A0ABD5RC81_9EURY|nr:30S ribosomal protein S27e [Salinirubrum litoreum]